MNIITSDFNFDFRYLKEPGSYEWIYFDMISDCGNYSLVVIFYCGFPFASRYNKAIRKFPHIPAQVNLSATDFPAVSFCLYKERKRIVNIHRIFTREQLSVIGNEIRIGDNTLKTISENGINKYLLNINLDFPYRKAKLISGIEITETVNILKSEETNYFTEFDEKHFWSPRSPLTCVKANIKINDEEINLNGKGYSDRNYGVIPVFHNIKEWFWGRFHSEKVNLIYYHINYFNNEPMRILFLYDSKGLTGFYVQFDENFSRKKNYFLLNYFKEIKVSNEFISFKIVNSERVDNGPFYIRFLSDFSINYKGNSIEGKGFSEYISPQRLRWLFLHPFINVKIKS